MEFEIPELEPEAQTFHRMGLGKLFGKPEKAKSSGWDSSKLLWGESSWDLLLEIDTTKIKGDPPSFNSEILLDVEFATTAVLRAFRETMQHSSERLIEAARLDYAQHSEMFPWLSWPPRKYVAHHLPGADTGLMEFNRDAPLAGQQSGPVDIAAGTIMTAPGIIRIPPQETFDMKTFDYSLYDSSAPLVVIKITSISFQEGTLWGWIEGKVLVLGLAATLLVGAVPPVVEAGKYYWNIHEWNQSIQKAQEAEPAYKYRGFRFASEELERIGERAFNYNERGISADERRHRIDMTQLASKVILKVEIAIDGQVGPGTLAALKEIGRRHNTVGAIENPFLRAELRKGLTQPK